MLPQTGHLSYLLRQHCALRCWAPQHVPPNKPADETQLLLEIIACRNAGRADLSLELIEIGELNEWKSPWLDDNRARAELELGNIEQACKIWEQLAHGDDPETAAVAKDVLQLIENSCQLQQKLLLCCNSLGWRPRHINEIQQPNGIKLEKALEEIQTCREEGATKVSQQLIECCRNLGYVSPWLDDNQARLLTIKDRKKAKEIWTKLSQHPNNDIQNVATKALKYLHDDESEAELLAAIEIDKGLNEPKNWKELLLQRRLETDGTDSSSWRRETIRLSLQETRPWDLHTSQHHLFQQLAQEQLDQWSQLVQDKA